jgi:hypothetical protein
MRSPGPRSGLPAEDLTVIGVPKPADEFTGSGCFLGHKRSWVAEYSGGRKHFTFHSTLDQRELDLGGYEGRPGG